MECCNFAVGVKRGVRFLVVLAVGVGLGAVAAVSYAALADKSDKADKGDKKVDTRVFELRTYTAAPGKLAALEARFRDHTNKLFEKHGMTVVGFWKPLEQKEGEEKLIYILAFPSKEAADKSWKEFQDDPDWQKVRDESEKDGKLLAKRPESVFLGPTDYSPIK